jgi:hypothetical protein
MKYLLFAGTEYYAKGGVLDLQKSSDSIEELVKFFYDKQDKNLWDWYQITDTDLNIVRQTEKQAHSY